MTSDTNTENGETVWIASHKTSTGKFHTDKDCRLCPTEARPRNHDLIESWGYSECNLCAKDNNDNR